MMAAPRIRVSADKRLAMAAAWVSMPALSHGDIATAFHTNSQTVYRHLSEIDRAGLAKSLPVLEKLWRSRQSGEKTIVEWGKALSDAIITAIVLCQPQDLEHRQPGVFINDADLERMASVMPEETVRAAITEAVMKIEQFTDRANRRIGGHKAASRRKAA